MLKRLEQRGHEPELFVERIALNEDPHGNPCANDFDVAFAGPALWRRRVLDEALVLGRISTEGGDSQARDQCPDDVVGYGR